MLSTEETDEAPRPFVDTEYGPAISQLGRYSDAVNKEFTLVSDRMSWLVISNSFMFAAFSSAAVNYEHAGTMQLLVAAMLVLMPLLGLAMAAFVIPALDAAHLAARRLKDKRDSFERRLPKHLQIQPISSKDKEHDAGNRPGFPEFLRGFGSYYWARQLGCSTTVPNQRFKPTGHKKPWLAA